MIYFLIPIYNEQENISNLFDQLKDILPHQEKFFVFSDDGSIDNSIKIIEESFSGLTYKIISDGINQGPGAAFNKGFEWILNHSQNEKDSVITLEADCTSDVSLVHKMVSINQLGFDLVLASVYAQGGGFKKTTFFRKLISSVANLMFRFLFDIKVLTLSSFYRCYSISILKKIKAKHSTLIEEKGFICMLEILAKAIKLNANIIEIPMVLDSTKRKGKSKMKIFKTTMQYFSFLVWRKY